MPLLPSRTNNSSILSPLPNGRPEPEQSYHQPEVESSSEYTQRVWVPGSWIDDIDEELNTGTVSDPEEESEIELEEEERGSSPEIEVETLLLEMDNSEQGEEIHRDSEVTLAPIIQTSTQTITVTPNSSVCSSSHTNSKDTSSGTSMGRTNPQTPSSSILLEPDNWPLPRGPDDVLEVSADSPGCSPPSSTGTTTLSESARRVPELDLEGTHWQESDDSPSPSTTVSSSSISTVPEHELEAHEVEPEVLPRREYEREYERKRDQPRARSMDTGLSLTALRVRVEVGDVGNSGSVTERQKPPHHDQVKLLQTESRRVCRPATSAGPRPDRATGTWQTSYRSPPTRARLPPESVLVRVWAVAVDCVDGLLAGSVSLTVGGGGRSDKPEEIGIEEDEFYHEGRTGKEDSSVIGGTDSEGTLNVKGPQQRVSRNPFMALSQTLSVRLGKRKKESLKGVREDKQQTGLDVRTFTFDRDSNLKGRIKLEPRPPTTGSTFKEAAPYIPGRSFVGQVEDVGAYVEGEGKHQSGLRKGEWIVGLVDLRKSGALAEFIVIDWRRVHRVPKECIAFPSVDHTGEVRPSPPSSSSSSTHEQLVEEERNNKQSKGNEEDLLTLEELALLPLCGIPAYRAISTFLKSFVDDHEITGDTKEPSSDSTDETDHSSRDDTPTQTRPYPIRSPRRRRRRARRALILRGTDGAGALAAQMLVRLGWRVSVHAPFSRVPENATQGLADAYMGLVEEQARSWGADEVIFDDAEAEREGKSSSNRRTREAVVRVMDRIRMDEDVFDAVLDTVGGKEIREAGERLLNLNTDIGQFTTLVGDNPGLVVPTIIDDDGKMGYSCVNVAHEDEQVFEMLSAILNLAIKGGVRPVVDDASGETFGRETRVLGFERALGVFMDGKNRDGWWLAHGGTLVIKLVA